MKKLQALFYYLLVYPYYKLIFKKLGTRSRIKSLLQADFPQNISIGSNVVILKSGWLAAVPLTDANICELVIGDNVRIGNFAHIYATNSVVIEDSVLIADKVYIADNAHDYEDVNVPVYKQKIKQLSSVTIGTGTWLGENVCVIGASVGKQCVIGANAVVTKDIGDYCIAVGAPAKIVKRYSFDTGQWLKTDAAGNFLEQ